MKSNKIISHSLFGCIGRNGNYWSYVPTLLRAHSLVFPDYKLVFYHDDIFFAIDYSKILINLRNQKLIDLHHMGKQEAVCKSMLWRCKAIWDYKKEATAVFFRDLDSCPTYRERCANEEFAESNYFIHGINDNPAHTIPLMGGMWGCKPKQFINYTTYHSWRYFRSYYKSRDFSIHGADQLFLRDQVTMSCKGKILVHKKMPIRFDCKIDRDVQDMKFCAFIGAAGYDRAEVFEFCEYKNNTLLKAVREAEDYYNIEPLTHNFEIK